jgi:hypothetical protein
MSQTDLDIANQSRSLVRAEINASLQALASCNSGASAPSTTYPFQLWADTSSGYLKQRNAANSGWITIFKLSTGALAQLDGMDLTGAINNKRSTVAATATTTPLWAAGTGNVQDWTGTPAITNFPAAPQPGVSRTVYPAAGTIFTDNANIDVQGDENYTVGAGDRIEIEALTTTTFKVWIRKKDGSVLDGKIAPAKLTTGHPVWDSAGNVGIGDATPLYRVHAQGAGQVGGYTNAGVHTSSVAAVDTGNLVGSGGAFLVGGKADTFFAAIKGWMTDGSSNTAGLLSFQLRTAAGDAGLSEKARIRADGSQESVIPGGAALYPEFKCRAWVNFNGTGTPAIRGSGNVTSITDNGVGDFTINFLTALPDANYAFTFGSQRNAGTSLVTASVSEATAPTASALRIIVTSQTAGISASADSAYNSIAIFR